MDKLQPILKQKYWICFGFALIFAFTGWWLGSNAIGTEITARRDVIEKAFTTAGQGADKPNQKWIEGAKALNLKDKEAYDASSRSLWERQKAARVWHPEIQKEISTVKFQDKIPQLSTRAKWATLYPKQFNEVLSVVKPFDVQTGTGLVVVNPQKITHKPFNSWVMRRPVSEEIWKSQEDLWLLKSLLSSIANVNGDASRITEASIREIVTLRLRGGDPAAAPTSGSAAGGGFGGGGSPSFGSAGGTAGAADGAAGGESGMATGGGGSGGPWKSFEGTFGMDLLTEQFGSADGAAAGAGGGGGSEDGGVLGGGFAGGMGAGGMTRGSTFGNSGGQAAAEEADRYVHDADDLPYKTRAFFLHVKMREEQVAELLASLTNSDFPVEIVRVDMKTNASGGAGGSGMMSGGGSGMSSGMGGMGSGGGIGGAPGMDMGGDAGEGLSLDGGGGAGMSLGGGGYSPPGMGGGDGGLLSGDGLAGGAGLGPDGGDLYGGFGAGQQQTGQQAMAAAFSPDQNLIELRVAGLMTLYQTKDEAEAQSETEAGTAQEAATSGGGGAQPAPAGDGTTPAAEGTTPPADGTTPPADGTTPAADGTTPAADGTAAPPADGGAAPADGTSPPAEGATPAPAGDGTVPPAEGTGTTPVDPATPAADPNAGPAPASPEPGGTAPPATGGNP